MNVSIPLGIHIVDDDEALADSLKLLLEGAGRQVNLFASGAAFRAALPILAPGCVLLDRRLPDADGVELLGEVTTRRPDLSVILLTGHGDVGAAVRAMKQGAVDFVEKPFEPRALADRVATILARAAEKHAAVGQARAAAIRLQKLTKREREVLDALMEGLPYKVAAHRLGISPRTIEIHRANAMEKLEVRAIPEAIRLVALAAGEQSKSPIG
jgi:two-component system response regulator FixJ